MSITVDIKIDSPKSKVWAAITDIRNCMNMISSISALKVLHEPEEGLIGLKWTETRHVFGKDATETMWITDCKDEEYYCTRAENHGAIYSTKLAVAEVGDKTLLTMSFAVTSDSFFIKVVSSVMGIFIKKLMLKMLEKDLDEIKAFVEKS